MNEPGLYCFIDFEFRATQESKLALVCCAWSLGPGDLNQVWLFQDDPAKIYLKHKLKAIALAGFTFVAYAVEAEARSFMALGLDPVNFQWIDLYLDYRMLLNHNHDLAYGHQLIRGEATFTKPPINKWKATEEELKADRHNRPEYGLGAAIYKLLDVTIDTDHKKLMRNRILASESFSADDRRAILEYCASDIQYLPSLSKTIDTIFERKLESSDWSDYSRGQLLRGEYAARTAKMVALGYPIDLAQVKRFAAAAGKLLNEMREDINRILEPLDFEPFTWVEARDDYKFNLKQARDYIESLEIQNWLKTKEGFASLSLEAFERQSSSRHDYKPTFIDQMLRFLRFQQSLNGFMPVAKDSKRKTFFDYVGSDERARPYFGIYGAQSARSQPGSTGFIPLKSAWMRCMIQPKPGRCIVSVDYGAQEILISALLSGDEEMLNGYMSGDPYLYLAKLAGAIPETGTRDEFEAERNLFKSTCLGINFGMTSKGLAAKLTADTGTVYTEAQAEEQIDLFYNAYAGYAQWKREILVEYREYGYLQIPCGWTMLGSNDNPRSIANFPVQGSGSTVMRRAVALSQDAGLDIIYTLHDALYCEFEYEDWSAIDVLHDSMIDAFKEVMNTTVIPRQDIFCWGPNLNDDGTLTTPKGYKVNTHSFYLDDRAINEYNFFKPYL